MPDNTEYRVTSVATYDANGNNGEGSWDPVPIGSESKYINISNDITNPNGDLAANEVINSSNVIVNSSDTGSTAWTKFNKFVNRVGTKLESAVGKTFATAYTTTNPNTTVYAATVLNNYMSNVIGYTNTTKPNDPTLNTAATVKQQIQNRLTKTGTEGIKRNLVLNPVNYNANFTGGAAYPPSTGIFLGATTAYSDSSLANSSPLPVNTCAQDGRILMTQCSYIDASDNNTKKQTNNMVIASPQSLMFGAGEGYLSAIKNNYYNWNDKAREHIHLISDGYIIFNTGANSYDSMKTPLTLTNAGNITMDGALTLNGNLNLTGNISNYKTFLDKLAIYKGYASVSNAKAVAHYLNTLKITEGTSGSTYIIFLHTGVAVAECNSIYFVSETYAKNAVTGHVIKPVLEGTHARAPRIVARNSSDARAVLCLNTYTTAQTVYWTSIRIN